MQRCSSRLTAMMAVSALACGGNDGPTGNNGSSAAGLAAVSGGGQRVSVGARLAAPFVVKVSDSRGDGVAGISIGWAVTAGGGNLSSTATTTDSQGLAQVSLTAGSSAGVNSVTATAAGLGGSPVTFSATAVAPAAIGAVAGNGQSGRSGQILAAPLVVLVTAGDNGPVPGVRVNWAVTAGGGSLSAVAATTDADGRASVTHQLGATAGAHTVTAAVDGFAGMEAPFTADATAPVRVTVEMRNITFIAPGGGDDVTVLLGDTVHWVNLDAESHTATSTAVPQGGASFDSGTLGLNDTFLFVPKTRGEWVYRCELHPLQMSEARITVQ